MSQVSNVPVLHEQVRDTGEKSVCHFAWNGLNFWHLRGSDIMRHQAFRFEVFVDECGYIDRELCQRGLECDHYDDVSTHCAVENERGEIIACTRLTFDNDQGKSYTEEFFLLPEPPLPRGQIAEINRFGIRRDYRTLGGEGRTVRLGLYLLLLLEAERKDVAMAYLTVHRSFSLLLRRDKVPFIYLDNYDFRLYSGYYAKYFDPSDTLPAVIGADAMRMYLHYEGCLGR